MQLGFSVQDDNGEAGGCFHRTVISRQRLLLKLATAATTTHKRFTACKVSTAPVNP